MIAPDRVPRFYFDPERRDEIVADLRLRHPGWIARCLERAEEVLQNPRYQDPRWSVDEATGYEWPRRFYGDLDIYRPDPRKGDVRLLWEESRHGALVDLAKAAFLSNDPRYRDRCLDLLADWRRANPYGLGIHWTSALEVAMRALAWTWIYFFLGGKEGVPGGFGATHRAGIFEHVRYVERHRSTYFSPNNHLIGEATAVYVVGAVFRDFASARRWERLGWDTLEREATRQFHPDGGNSEQATCYHSFSLGLYLQALALRLLLGDPARDLLKRRLELALWFSLHLRMPDGSMPMIGDNDDAVAFPASEQIPWRCSHYLALGAVLYESPELRWGAGEWSEFAHWLSGTAGRERFEALDVRPPARRCVSFPASGYCVGRDGWSPDSSWYRFDCGPLSEGVSPDGPSSAAHGHADALSVEVAVRGLPFIVDPGNPSYNGDPEWLRHFRGTAAHATLTVNGAGQSEAVGRLRWRHAARATLERWHSLETCDYAQGSHDGYVGRFGVLHRRGLFHVREWGWVVWDRLEGEGVHQVATTLAFAPGTSIRGHGSAWDAARNDRALTLRFAAPEAASARVDAGGAGPADGWLAPSYRTRVAAPALRIEWRLSLPCAIWHVYRIGTDRAAPITLTARSGNGAEAVVLKDGPDARLYMVARGEGGAPEVGALRTDARLLSITRREGSRTARVEIVCGSWMTWGSRDVIRRERAAEYVCLECPDLPESLDPELGVR